MLLSSLFALTFFLLPYLCLSVSSSGASALSADGIVSVAGTVYSSLAQRPKSISLQRSEQKGRVGLSCHGAGFPQIGHFIKSKKAKVKRQKLGGNHF
jgi:hypothetical protein